MDKLPTKKKITLKLFSSNKLDQQTNPLNSRVSLNHKPETNLMAKGNFQALGKPNRQGAKHQSR
jgi:hypothetical protein